MNSATLPDKVAGGDLDGKGEDDDWVIGIGGTSALRGEPAGQLEQTNIHLGVPCPSDLNGDGSVNVHDLLLVIAAWGDCETCPEDLNADGHVNVHDILLLIGDWGDCL